LPHEEARGERVLTTPPNGMDSRAREPGVRFAAPGFVCHDTFGVAGGVGMRTPWGVNGA